MTWKEFFEEALQRKREIVLGKGHFKILTVGEEMVVIGGEEHREYVSYNAIVSVGDYNENGKTLVLYTVAGAIDVDDLQHAVEEMKDAIEQA